MTNDPFESCRAKIDRANFHLKQLTRDIRAAEANLYGLAVKDDPHTGERIIEASLPRPLFVGFSIVAGEVIHQARSSLDNLVTGLRIINGTTSESRVSGFPIFSDRDKYEKNGRRMINGLHRTAIAVIDGLQPIKPDFATDPLYVLNELWNRDKHRLLNFASIRLNAFKQTYSYPSGRFSESPILSATTAMEAGAELGRFRPPGALASNVKAQDHLDYSGPIFQDAGPATDHEVLEILSRLVQFTENIANSLITAP